VPKFFTEASEELADNDFLSLPVEHRLAIYQGIAIAVAIDPYSVSRDQLHLLSYGYHRDTEVIAAVGQDEWEAGFVPVWDSIIESDDQDIMWNMMQGDAIEDESLQVPLMAAALVAAFYGGAGALGATGVIGGGATGSAGAGAGIGSAQGVVASAAQPAVAFAARLTGLIPTAVIGKIALWGSGTVLAAGTVLGAASMWDNAANLEENEIARLDAINEAAETRSEIDRVDANKAVAETAQRYGDWADSGGSSAPGGVPAGTKAMVNGQVIDVFDENGHYTDEAWAELEAGRSLTGGGDPEVQQAQSTNLPQGTIGEGLDNPPYAGDAPPDDPLLGITEQFRSYTGQYGQRSPKHDPDDPWGGERHAGPNDASGQPGNYRNSDWEKLIKTIPEWKVDWVQRMLVDAGRINQTDTTGLMDRTTVAHIGILLEEANQNNTSWTSWTQRIALEGLRLQKEEDEAAKQARLDALGPFVRKAYFEPDAALLREISETAIEQQLGRKVNDWEMQLMVAEQNADYQEAHRIDNDYAYQQHQLQVRAIEEDLGYEDTIGGGTVQTVDVGARFQQQFDKRFKKELSRREDVSDVSARVGDMMSSVTTGMRTMGG